MTVTVFIMAGLPASGKSEFARGLDALRFNLDDIRSMLGITPETWSREQEDIAINTMLEGMKSAVLAGKDVVADNTHLVPRLPHLYRQEIGQLDVEFAIHDFTDVPLEECIRRDAARPNGVGEEVIQRLHANMVGARKNGWRLTAKWMTPERGEPPKPYKPNLDLPEAIICDIDGTVAINDGHRGHYDYDKVLGDKPNWPVINMVQHLSKTFMVKFVSGREDRCREDTLEWLRNIAEFYWVESDGLFMRTTGDHRKDFLIKTELFDANLRDAFNVIGVFDDRDQVVEHCWRAIGIQTYQVADGAF